MGHQRSGAQAKALAGAVLAYAENIDDPGVLAPVIELICHKHVSLNIKAPDYSIVGENLLYSISEVLSVPMESPLISAWGAAYQDLAEIFIGAEKRLYDERRNTPGRLAGLARLHRQQESKGKRGDHVFLSEARRRAGPA
ncbi:Nitric oxide dioxygenase [Leclercia adecarboxylata]|uniref:Nitric oxide dioxygenase n=1 Tax=Leclercia adecarboxylata TaxID=83655 RepID=A0A4U9I0H5_9ENTR|nr:Nitric oxide dioxygenase [Leclercia adecarboxylata]